mgnify:CR=1 FL=1
MRICLGLAAVCLASALSTNAGAQTVAWEIDSPEPFRNNSWSFGDIFTVGSQNITVYGLGAFDAGLDGFSTLGGIQVGLYDELTSTLLSSTNVLSTDTLVGDYRFGSITPLELTAGSQYRVVAVNGSDLYNIALGTPDSVNPLLNWNSYGYCLSTTLQSCNTFTGTERSWMANLQLSVGAVPEPSTWAMMLIGFGAVGAALRRRRAVSSPSLA